MSFYTPYQRQIIDYYRYSEIDYRLLWHLDTKKSMHYGYWDAHTRTLREALDNMNKRLFEFSGAAPGSNVLDAGCGVGGTAIYLAKKYQCNVTGITLPPQQYQLAVQNINVEKLAHQITIIQGDYCQTGLPDSSFNLVCALESSCHAPDKKSFLAECFRLLQPKGILVIADYFEKTQLNIEEKKLMNQWARSWSIDHFWNEEQLYALAANVGFINAVFSDRTVNILKSSKRLYWYFFPGIVLNYIFKTLALRNHIHTLNTYSAYYQYKTLKRGLWKYGFFKAIKP